MRYRSGHNFSTVTNGSRRHARSSEALCPASRGTTSEKGSFMDFGLQSDKAKWQRASCGACFLLLVGALLIACGGSGGGEGSLSGALLTRAGLNRPDREQSTPTSPASVEFAIGGTVEGLIGAVTLRDGTGQLLSVSENGTFRFPRHVIAGTTYAIVVVNQPYLQQCAVEGGYGKASADAKSIVVTCKDGLR